MTSGTGTCSVRYDQAGSANFNAAPQVVEIVSAQKADQTISVSTHAPGSAVNGTSFTVAATAPAGAVAFSSAGACSNTGGVFTMTSGTGTCSVRYDQAGNAGYNAAPQVVENVAALAAATVPDAPTGVTASGGDGQATVSWTAPASDGGASITGYNVTAFVGGVAQPPKSVGVVTQTDGERAGERNDLHLPGRGGERDRDGLAVGGVEPGDAEGEPDDRGDDARAVLGGVRIELLGCGDGAGRCGDVLERGCVLELGGDVHDDEQHRDVLGEVRPGRQRGLQRGAAGRRGRERAEGRPDDQRLDARAGERR